LFFTALAVLIGTLAAAQNVTVTGTVKDASDGSPIPFASVHLKGTMTGVSSDAEGQYSIKVPADGVLVYSTVGYKTVEIQVASRGVINVALEVDTEHLSETIVIAFGQTTKEAFTGSATVVKSSDIAKVQSSNATRALEGVVAGVQMTTPSGALGSSPSIRIRGISSISAGSAPLYVVDGVPYSGDINNINSADIESMTVLKDAASNALYGSRGANGVIMITTKRAKRGEAVVTLDARVGVNTKALQDYEYITDPGQYYEAHYMALKNYYMQAQGLSSAEAHNKAAANVAGPSKNGGTGYNVYEVPEGEFLIGSNGRLNPAATLGRTVEYNGQKYRLLPDNWLDNVYTPSIRQEYNASISGSTDRASFYASLGMLDNKGIIPGSSMRRYTAKLRADYQAKSWLKAGASASYANYIWKNANPSESAGSTGSIFGIAVGMAPIYPLFIRDENGEVMEDVNGFTMYDFGNGANAGMNRPNAANANPLATSLLDRSESEGNALDATGYIEIKFLKDFTLTVNGGFGLDETRSRSMSNPYYGQFVTNGGNISVGHGRTTFFNFQQLLNYHRTFAEKHTVDALIGHEYYKSHSYSLSAAKTKLFSVENMELNGAVVDAKSAASSNSWYNNEGYFARVQYDYANRLFLSASYRRDASSRFHPKHRWGNFWSVGAGWLINHEPWFNASWVDMLKIKASIGSQGNDNISNYLYTDTYSVTNSNDEIGITFQTKGNENITWETNTNFNAGVDFGFFGGRLNGTVEYFYRKTSDMLFFFTVPASLGYSGYYDNIGDMRNSGVEFSIDGAVIANRNFTWNINLNATHYTNKILYLPEEKKTVNLEGYDGYASGNYFYGEGLPLYTFKMPKSAGVEATTGKAMWYKDIIEDGKVVGQETTTEYSEATDYICKAPTPKLYGGFGTNFSFYGVDIAVQFTYQIGGLSIDSGYRTALNAPGGSLGYNFHKDIYKSWTPDNPSSEFPRFQYLDENQNALSDRFLTDASYLNFQNAQIGYTFPSKLTQKIKISKIRIYASADNIWYVSARKGFDPRYSFSGTTNYATNSTVRTISGGLSITF
ncbi:MAG: SusC/RagA family TonB-linked outer membrane protein, partial [Candidatus Cryptobacteroides sp.]